MPYNKPAAVPGFRTLGGLEREFTPEALRNRPEPISTGFPSLDEKLGGGLLPGLYVLGAVSSLGKSTFSLQMAENIAARDKRPVLYFSMEMGSTAIGAKSLTRAAFRSSGGRMTSVKSRDLMVRQSGEAAETIGRYTGQAREGMKELGSLHIYTPWDSGELLTADRIVEIANSARGKLRPVVIVDYLQILPAPPEERDYRDSRIAIDRNVRKLHSLKDMAVLVISALNREAYYEPMSMSAFKESGSIEYSADVLLGMEFSEIHKGQPTKKSRLDWLTEQKQRCPRLVDISILKQRYGESNVRVPFRYYSAWDCFQQACDPPFDVPGQGAGAPAPEPEQIPAEGRKRKKRGAKPARRERVFRMNNSGLGKMLRFWQTGRESCDGQGRLVYAPFPDRPDIKTILREPGFEPGEGRAPGFTEITYWDMMVADAVFSIYQEQDLLFSGHKRPGFEFRAVDVLRMLSGDMKKPNKIALDSGAGIYRLIQDSIARLRSIKIFIDCAAELELRNGTPAYGTISGSFLTVWSRDPGEPERVHDIVYSFREPGSDPGKKPMLQMPLYQYVIRNTQVLSVGLDALATPRGADGKPAFSDSRRNLTIKHFAARSLAIARWYKDSGRGGGKFSKLHLDTGEGLFRLLEQDRGLSAGEDLRKKGEAFGIVCDIVAGYKKAGRLTPSQEIPAEWENSLQLSVSSRNWGGSGGSTL